MDGAKGISLSLLLRLLPSIRGPPHLYALFWSAWFDPIDPSSPLVPKPTDQIGIICLLRCMGIIVLFEKKCIVWYKTSYSNFALNMHDTIGVINVFLKFLSG